MKSFYPEAKVIFENQLCYCYLKKKISKILFKFVFTYYEMMESNIFN